jgi:hypothetical protein
MALMNTPTREGPPSAAIVPEAAPRLFGDVVPPKPPASPAPVAPAAGAIPTPVPATPGASPAASPPTAFAAPPPETPPAQTDAGGGSEDPFDPAVFNRQMHPEKK